MPRAPSAEASRSTRSTTSPNDARCLPSSVSVTTSASAFTVRIRESTCASVSWKSFCINPSSTSLRTLPGFGPLAVVKLPVRALQQRRSVVVEPGDRGAEADADVQGRVAEWDRRLRNGGETVDDLARRLAGAELGQQHELI